MSSMNVNEEVERLQVEIKRLGRAQPDGSVTVTFGVLFKDDVCLQVFEAIVGTLKAAKKRGIVKYDSELLLSPVHDNVVITLGAAHVPA